MVDDGSYLHAPTQLSVCGFWLAPNAVAASAQLAYQTVMSHGPKKGVVGTGIFSFGHAHSERVVPESSQRAMTGLTVRDDEKVAVNVALWEVAPEEKD